MARNIEDYFFGLSSKSCLIIWLLESGYSTKEISQMQVKQLNKVLKALPRDLPKLKVWCEECIDEFDDHDRVFEKQKGVAMSKDWILSILIKAQERVGEEFISVKKFIESVDVSNESCSIE